MLQTASSEMGNLTQKPTELFQVTDSVTMTLQDGQRCSHYWQYPSNSLRGKICLWSELLCVFWKDKRCPLAAAKLYTPIQAGNVRHKQCQWGNRNHQVKKKKKKKHLSIT